MVERGATPTVSRRRRRVLDAARAMTTPLLPDDYLELLDPRWSTREATGQIVEIRHEPDDMATIVIKPLFPWPGHKSGQYLRIGVKINGIRHWRAYSITSDPEHPHGLVSITVKCVDGGMMSSYFVRQAEPGTEVFLGEIEGTFVLPDPLPAKPLFISAGSGITPVMSMIRELARRDALADTVHVHCARSEDRFVFRDMLHGLAATQPGYTLHTHFTDNQERLKPADLEQLCPDWRERDALLSGPEKMINAFRDHWTENGAPGRLAIEHFQPIIGAGDTAIGAGGSVRFRVTDVDADCGPGISVLVGGEVAGAKLTFGCRMGICHTCVGRLCHGRLRDLRTGELHGEEGQMVRICVNAPEGHVEIDL